MKESPVAGALVLRCSEAWMADAQVPTEQPYINRSGLSGDLRVLVSWGCVVVAAAEGLDLPAGCGSRVSRPGHRETGGVRAEREKATLGANDQGTGHALSPTLQQRPRHRCVFQGLCELDQQQAGHERVGQNRGKTRRNFPVLSPKGNSHS